MESKETLQRLGNEKIVVKGNWDGTIGKKPQYDHLTTIKEHFKNEYATLLKSLERLEELEKENQELKARCKAIPPLAIKNEKLVKAISILKKKRTDLDELLSCETLQEFNDGYYKKWQLTQQEFDLLCEVFGE